MSPDLTWAGNPPKLGFGLWNHPEIEMPLELAITFGALWFFALKAKPKALPLLILAAFTCCFASGELVRAG